MINRFSSPLGPTGTAQPGYAGNRSDVEREYPLVQQHDDESADIRAALGAAAEVCNINGASLEVFERTDNYADDVWDEDADPTYWAPTPIKGFFAPGAIEVVLKTWGADAVVKLEVYFATKTLRERLRFRAIRGGDVLLVPFNAIGNAKPRLFRIENATPIGPYKYTWLYVKCNCESMTGDPATLPRLADPAGADGIQLSDR